VIHRIKTSDVPDLWELVKPHADKAMEWHPFLNSDDVFGILLDGHAQLFVVTKDKAFLGFAVMEVIQYPRRNVANVLAAGGHRGFLSVSVKDLFPVLEDWAREQGADTFAVQGRPGWLRVAESFKGSERLKTGIAWRRLGYERRRFAQSDDAGIGTVERGAAVSSGPVFGGPERSH
jgi:hypothetical protein